MARGAFLLSLVFFGGVLGYLVHRHAWWPTPWVEQAELAYRTFRDKLTRRREWYYFDLAAAERTRVHRPEAMQPGPTLVAFVGANNHQYIEVIAPDGAVLNAWRVDWFDLWPNADHLPEQFRPKDLPGAIVHGVWLMGDGGVLLQHDACGLVRLDACGHIVWRLAQRTHHSLHLDERGHIWTSIRHTREERPEGLLVYDASYEEYTIAEISPEGKLLREYSLFDLLRRNELSGLLMMSTYVDESPRTGGDTLHVNDVEVFPRHLAPGVFQPGDVMVSLRRPNTVIVFNLAEERVRYVSTGGFVHQHDPDFLDGNTVAIFDNHHIASRSQGAQSRILTEDARTGERSVAFAGTPEHPFFTDIMGKQQWLPNGNRLLVEATAGRLLEVDREGQLVWEFFNVVEEGTGGAVAEGTRLDPRFTAGFFAARRAECGKPLSEAPGRVPPP